jgi:hypothetical protein
MIGKFTTIIVLSVALASCGIRATLLGNNETRIPQSANVYKNRGKFDSSVLKHIDTSVLYEEIGDMVDSVLHERRFKNYEMYNYGVFRFYSNGFMNFFVMFKDPPYTAKQLDPAYTGTRGIYYTEGDKIKGELFRCGKRKIRKLNLHVTTKGDTLFVTWTNLRMPQQVYIKRKLPPEFLKYKIAD